MTNAHSEIAHLYIKPGSRNSQKRYERSCKKWIEPKKTLAKKTYVFVKGNFPTGSEIRRDDVAKGLLPLIEVDEGLRAELHKSRLTQRYWITYFTDLIIDQTWNEITMEEKVK